jgi:DNA mismatch repair ATPase MutS
VREFGLVYSRTARAGEMRLAGFPISRCEEWVAKVVARGSAARAPRHLPPPALTIVCHGNAGRTNRYKVARVDELENSVTKSMREKKQGGKKVRTDPDQCRGRRHAHAAHDGGHHGQDKVIERKLSTVYTAGTLVYSSVLTDDMATYCLALKVRAIPRGWVQLRLTEPNPAHAHRSATMARVPRRRSRLRPSCWMRPLASLRWPSCTTTAHAPSSRPC